MRAILLGAAFGMGIVVSGGCSSNDAATAVGAGGAGGAAGATAGMAGTSGNGGVAGTGGSTPAGGAAGIDGSAGAKPVDAGPAPEASVTTVTSITKDGITWTFSQPVAMGQFVTGDYYVVGPVTVAAVSPAPTDAAPYLNGSVVNLPTKNGKSGFDSRLNDGDDQSWWFDAAARARFPATLNAGDAMVSSISLDQTHSVAEVMRASDKNASPVRTVSVLTVLGAMPPGDAFRPSYCDRKQTMYRAGAVQRSLLPSKPSPNPTGTPPLAQFETWLRRPWIDTNGFLFDVPAEYMPSYGQHVAFVVGHAALLLTLDFAPEQKVPLTNYLVQYGIDLFGCLGAGYGWPAFGGHRSGRKLPIVMAGILLGDDAMKNASATYPNQFGEDMQTVDVTKIPGAYQQAWQGAKVIYGGHYGVDQTTGQPTSTDPLYGPYEQLQPKNWPVTAATGGYQLGESYRRCCTSVSWVGEALAVRMMGAVDTWNHPAFFDYVDRWMKEDDAQAIADIKTQSGFDYSQDWERQGQTRYWLQGEFPQATFVDDMWKAYR
jgi:hypothetical protein